MMKHLAILVLVCSNLGACYRSYDRQSGAGPAECGNGIVESGEECDTDLTGACTGDDACPGFRWCNDDCTWGDCVTGGFGIRSGPTVLSEDVLLESVSTTSTTWTGSRYGVVYAASRLDPWPAMETAIFTALDTGSTIVVEPYQVLPDMFPVGEADVSHRTDTGTFGAAFLVLDEGTGSLLFNLLDEDGRPLIDPGVAWPTASALEVRIVSGEESFGTVWRDMDTNRVVFGQLTPDMGIGASTHLDELSPIPFHRLPSIEANETGFAALWHVDDPAEGTSALRYARLSNDSDLISGITILFAEMDPQPPSDLAVTDGDYGLIFCTQPYFDSPVLDLNIALIGPTGTIDRGPFEAGTVLRHENLDARLEWAETEFGIVLATPLAEEPGAIRTLAFRRYLPEGTMIGTEFRISVDGDASVPSVTWDGEAYGVSYAVGREDGDTDVEFIRLGCIPPD
jgi:hypothetical protein